MPARIRLPQRVAWIATLAVALPLTAAGQPPPVRDEQIPDKANSGRTDVYDDPLPGGAVARLGSVRLRHAGLSDFVFLPDGKTVLSAGSDRVLRFWDTATGRLVRAVKLQGSAGPGQPSVECGHSAELNQVSSTSGSCVYPIFPSVSPIAFSTSGLLIHRCRWSLM